MLNKSYYNGNGKHQVEMNYLQGLVFRNATVPPIHHELIKVQQIYYDLYNNTLINCKKKFKKLFLLPHPLKTYVQGHSYSKPLFNLVEIQTDEYVLEAFEQYKNTFIIVQRDFGGKKQSFRVNLLELHEVFPDLTDFNNLLTGEREAQINVLNEMATYRRLI